jgi:hypothetical protein
MKISASRAFRLIGGISPQIRDPAWLEIQPKLRVNRLLNARSSNSNGIGAPTIIPEEERDALLALATGIVTRGTNGQ